MDDAFGHWLAGFIDGEGCFMVYGPEGGHRRCCKFTLKLRGDDVAVLVEIVEKTGIGRVRHQPNKQRTLPQYGWLVDTKADCVALVVLLDRYPLRAKKARDYAIWREGVAEWNRMHGNLRQDWSRMDRLHRALRAVRHYDNAGMTAEAAVPPAEFVQLALK
jgi:hypothetical protein